MSGGNVRGTGAVSAMEVLGELICRLNPYTERKDLTSPRTTGKMDVFLAPLTNYPPQPDPGNPGRTLPPQPNPYSQVELEVDSKYAADWTFKGQPQRVNTAVRIKYRYPVLDGEGNQLYWVEDFLLLGYEGAGGV